MEPIWVVIPAAGIGSRMGGDRPKQYLSLLGKPVIEHSLELFLNHPSITGVVVALSADDTYWPSIESTLSASVMTVLGGEQRAHSVLNGLSAVPDENAWVMVHDAARPCLTQTDLERLIQSRSSHVNGAILGLPIIDTLKKIGSKKETLTPSNITIEKTFDRNEFYRALTPQFAPLSKLKPSLIATQSQQVTDEAQAMELSGYSMGIVVGRDDNIKITYEQDLVLAEFYLRRQMELGLREQQ